MTTPSPPPATGRGAPSVYRGDVAVAAVVLAVVAGFWFETTRFPQVPALLAQNIPPSFFPRLVLATIGVLALILPFEPLMLRRPGAVAEARRWPAATWKTVALLALVVAAIPWLGLIPAAALVSLALPLLWGERRWRILLPFVVLFPAAIHVVFAVLLNVRFEPGLLLPLLGVN